MSWCLYKLLTESDPATMKNKVHEKKSFSQHVIHWMYSFNLLSFRCFIKTYFKTNWTKTFNTWQCWWKLSDTNVLCENSIDLYCYVLLCYVFAKHKETWEFKKLLLFQGRNWNFIFESAWWCPFLNKYYFMQASLLLTNSEIYNLIFILWNNNLVWV